MGLNICPAHGYPRLFRFDLNDDRVLSELDVEQNLLRINPYLYHRLPAHLQREVFATAAKILTVDQLY